MQEYLIRCQGHWWHFFMKPFYGLCFRKRENGRFLNFEVLLPEACEDFCAAGVGDGIHIVCQDKSGSILYLTQEKEVWHKTTLLESKSSVPYPKYFSLVPMGGFLNLFYVIAYQEKHMLVHQILSAPDKPPTVVDRITLQSPPFLSVAHTGTDITVLYENESGISGQRLYRWSRKEFGRFVPVHPAAGPSVRGALVEPGDRVRYAALQTVDSVSNLVYFEKTEQGQDTPPVTVYLDCPKDAVPVFCHDGGRLYLSWRENGGVMSSYSVDDGGKWSKPVRYMKGASVSPVLYGIWEGGAFRQAYGYEQDRDIMLYACPGLQEEMVERTRPAIHPRGYEAQAFARSMGMPEEESRPTADPVVEQLQDEIRHIKNQLFDLRQMIAKLSEEQAKPETEEAAKKPKYANEGNGGVAVNQSVS